MFGIFFIFTIMVFIRKINTILEKDSNELLVNNQTSKSVIINYLPFVFHIVIVLLIIFSLFSIKLLDDEKIDVLIADISFQFYSSILLVIIGLINPFTNLSATTAQKITEFSNQTKNNFLLWLIEGKNFQFVKILVCTLFTAYFFYNDYIKIPALNNGILSSVSIFLIFFYLFNSLVELFKNPRQFRSANILRLTLLTNSLKKSFFILIGTIVLVYIPSAIFKLGIDENINPIIFGLIAYNVLMANNEFRLIKIINKANEERLQTVIAEK